MKKDLVSIIIPVYNTDKAIERCLNSLLRQTYQNFEALFIDDGSTNGVDKIIKEYAKKDKRIKYYYKENSGVSATRNFGIKKSVGKYISFLDSDDEYTDNALQILVDSIQKYDCDFVKANFYYSKDNEKLYKFSDSYEGVVENTETKQNFLNDIIDGTMSTFIWCLLLKRDFLLSIELFNEKIDYMEDKVFYFNIFSNAQKYYLTNEKIYYYYFNDFNNKDNKYWFKYLKNINLVFEAIAKISRKNHNNMFYNKICNDACLQINFVIFNIYKNDNTTNIKEIFSKNNLEFISNIKIAQNNNLYSKICLFLINHKLFNPLKLMYNIKKIKANKCKENNHEN